MIRFVTVDGIRLRTSVRGCGPPLLLVTGLGASLDMARPFEQELTARGVQTVAFDAPGIGESTAYTLPRRMPGIARTIEVMLDALGYDRVDVLGVSLGTGLGGVFVALRIYGGEARRDPDALLHGSPARFVERPSVRGYLGQMYAIAGWTSLPWLHRLRQPTLVMAGDDDPIVPLLNGRILVRRIPDARLHVVDGGGHLFLL